MNPRSKVTHAGASRRAWLLTAAGATAGIGSVAACGVGAPKEEVGVQRGARTAKLTWYATGGQSRQDLHKKQVARFKEIAGHDVDVVAPTGNYMDKLVADLSAGSSSVNLRSSWLNTSPPAASTHTHASRNACGL